MKNIFVGLACAVSLSIAGVHSDLKKAVDEQNWSWANDVVNKAKVKTDVYCPAHMPVGIARSIFKTYLQETPFVFLSYCDSAFIYDYVSELCAGNSDVDLSVCREWIRRKPVEKSKYAKVVCANRLLTSECHDFLLDQPDEILLDYIKLLDQRQNVRYIEKEQYDTTVIKDGWDQSCQVKWEGKAAAYSNEIRSVMFSQKSKRKKNPEEFLATFEFGACDLRKPRYVCDSVRKEFVESEKRKECFHQNEAVRETRSRDKEYYPFREQILKSRDHLNRFPWNKMDKAWVEMAKLINRYEPISFDIKEKYENDSRIKIEWIKASCLVNPDVDHFFEKEFGYSIFNCSKILMDYRSDCVNENELISRPAYLKDSDVMKEFVCRNRTYVDASFEDVLGPCEKRTLNKFFADRELIEKFPDGKELVCTADNGFHWREPNRYEKALKKVCSMENHGRIFDYNDGVQDYKVICDVENGGWRYASSEEMQIGLCGSNNQGEKKLFKGDYLICDESHWRKPSRPEELGGLCGKLTVKARVEDSLNLDRASRPTVYFCEKDHWRKATPAENMMGRCPTEASIEDRVSLDAYGLMEQICDENGWRDITNRGEYLAGFCTKNRQNDSIYDKKNSQKYYCDGERWRFASADEMKGGLCTDKNIGMRIVHEKGAEMVFRVCDRDGWRMASAVEYYNGLCNSKRKNGEFGIVSSADSTLYFECRDGRWNPISEAVMKNGTCNEIKQGHVGAVATKAGKVTCRDLQWVPATQFESALGSCIKDKKILGSYKEKNGLAGVCDPKMVAWRDPTPEEKLLKSACTSANLKEVKKQGGDVEFRCGESGWKGSLNVSGKRRISYPVTLVNDVLWMDSNSNTVVNPFIGTNSKKSSSGDFQIYSFKIVEMACPNGWRVPTVAQWKSLMDYQVSFVEDGDYWTSEVGDSNGSDAGKPYKAFVLNKDGRLSVESSSTNAEVDLPVRCLRQAVPAR